MAFSAISHSRYIPASGRAAIAGGHECRTGSVRCFCGRPVVLKIVQQLKEAAALQHSMKIVPSDISIIRCLHDDARMSVVQIAKIVGLPESTVRNRLSRLTESGILNFVAVTDPLKLGYQLWVMIAIQADLTRIDEVARALANIPEIYFVAVTTGGYEIMVSAAFRSNDEFLRFVTERLSTILGITRTITYNVLKIYKRQMSVLPPAKALSEYSAHQKPMVKRRTPARKKRS
jgi:Lrp/AsnC family transcriptional regulator for asnA, asnC and gidA